MKIVILDAYTANPGDLSWKPLEQIGEVVVYARTSPDQVISRAKDAEIVLTNKVVLDADVISALPNLQYIGVLATGTNVVDIPYAQTRGIVVTNIPGYSTESVVQSTFAHILNLTSCLATNTSAVRNGDWTTCADFSFSKGKLSEIYGKRLGIVGFGTIGRRVAQIAIAFGMNVIAYGPRLQIGETINGVLIVSLEKLFSTSDVISLHCPLNNATLQLVNSSRLATVKRGALLINTGRGPLLDEQAVADALVSGKLGGVGVDVLTKEPPLATNPLLKAPNCFITPHNAWASYEARRRLIQIATDNIIAFVEGRSLNIVN